MILIKLRALCQHVHYWSWTFASPSIHITDDRAIHIPIWNPATRAWALSSVFQHIYLYQYLYKHCGCIVSIYCTLWSLITAAAYWLPTAPCNYIDLHVTQWGREPPQGSVMSWVLSRTQTSALDVSAHIHVYSRCWHIFEVLLLALVAHNCAIALFTRGHSEKSSSDSQIGFDNDPSISTTELWRLHIHNSEWCMIWCSKSKRMGSAGVEPVPAANH